MDFSKYSSLFVIIPICIFILFRDKMNTIDTNDFANALDIEGEKRRRVYLWTLMALTRALDTMVITIKEPNSEVGRILKQFADIYPDFIDWQL